jgi:hypothetical protein
MAATLKELFAASLTERWRKDLNQLSDDQLNRIAVKMVEWFLYTAANDLSNELPNIFREFKRGKINFLVSGDLYQANGGMVDFLSRLYEIPIKE